MPALSNHHDLDGEGIKRAAQEDPWVMYLVVRKSALLSEAELYQAAAASCLACVASYEDDPEHQEAFAAWFERSFRKVALRASESEWARLNELDGASAAGGGVEAVRCLPPRKRSEREPLLAKLQVYNPERERLRQEPERDFPDKSASLVLSAATFSAGKAVAQVAHAALMLTRSPLVADERYRNDFAAWNEGGRPWQVYRARNQEAWNLLKKELDCVVVRDGGLTEVEPGTETVLAAPPASALPEQAVVPLTRPSLGPAQAATAVSEGKSDPNPGPVL